MLRFYIVFSLVLCLEKGRLGTWRQMQQMKQMNEDMKRRGQKEHSKQGDKQNKTNLYSWQNMHWYIKNIANSTLLVK